MKFIRWQTACGQSRYYGAWSRDRLDPKSHIDRRLDDTLARVADAWTASIGHQRDFFTASESLENLLAAPGFIELKVTDQGLGNAEVFEQLTCSARIFRRHEVAFFEGSQGPQRNILEVADWRGHQVQSSWQQRRQ